MKVRTFVAILLIIGVSIGGVIGYQVPLSQISILESELKTQQVLHKNRIQEIETTRDNNIKYLESQIEGLLNQMESKMNEIDALKNQKTTLETTIHYLEEKVETEANQISILNEEIGLKDMELRTIRDLVNDLQKIVPVYEKGEWNHIIQFSGIGALNTPLFDVPSDQLRITWEYSAIDTYPYLVTELYHPSETLRVWSSGIIEDEYGATYLYNLSENDYYLKIIPSGGIGPWTVTVDAWVSE